MMRVENYVDGRWVDPKGERFESRNPMTGEPLASAPVSDARAVDQAVEAARRAFDQGDWRWRKGSERAAPLNALADRMAARESELAELIAREMGKPVRINRAREVEGAIDKLRFFAGAARMLEGRVTASTAAIFEIAHEAKLFPPGVINLVHGPGEPTGEALVGHPKVDKISFTGSTATGIRIMERAAARLAKVSLECGGKFPAVVFADADLERCLDAVTYGAFMYAGQSCTACARLVVEDRVHDAVVGGVVERTKKLPIGDPLDPKVLVGPMASRKQRDKVVSYIRLGLGEGAKAVAGGDPGERNDLFLQPTILVGAPDDGRIAREEVFGPVLTVHRFKDEQQALAIANGTPYGLGGSIWSQDISRALRLARRLDCADVWVNTHYVRHAETSFGGRHLSGLGRELGMAGVEEYVSWKRLCIDTRAAFHLRTWFEQGGA